MLKANDKAKVVNAASVDDWSAYRVKYKTSLKLTNKKV